MNNKKIISAIIKACITIIILVVIGMFVYKLCVKTYDFGFRIFAEEPMSPAPGYKVTVTIAEGKSVMEIGEILKAKGLVRSPLLFYLQEKVSNYHGMIQPGVYDLSTAMTPEEMMQIMSNSITDEDQEGLPSSEADENTTIEGESVSGDSLEGLADDGTNSDGIVTVPVEGEIP